MATRQDELLERLISILENLDLRYFVTGSVAAIYYGEPRLTNDIDVVVDLPKQRVREFCESFPTGEFYISEEAIDRASGFPAYQSPCQPGRRAFVGRHW